MRDGQPALPVTAARSEEATYARLLWWSGWTGFVLLVLGFLAYVTGALPPLIDVESLARVWRLPARELAAQEGHPTGWGWVALLGHGDIFNLLGIATLATCSALPLTAIAALYWRRRERLHALLAAAQVLVLLLAASGMIAAGH